MKKILLVIILIIMLVMGLAPTLFAAEKSSIEEVKSIVLKSSVEVNTTGILPTNPFYFLKEWKRGVKRALIANSVSRAEYELQIASEKIAELRKLKELYPNDSRAIKTTILNYSGDIKHVLENLEAEHPSIKDRAEDAQLLLERELID